MRKLLIITLFLQGVFACEAIWHNGPTQFLKEVFAITEVSGVDDLETATKQANFRWVRPKGLERWHVYSLLDDSQRSKLTKVVKHSALAKAKMPQKKHYCTAVVFGATTSRVKNRIDFLVRLAKQGITFDKVYLLGSTRDLKTGPEADQKMASMLKVKGPSDTEMGMMEYVWKQTAMPDSLRSLQVISIQSGERPDGTRANTDDTLIDMVKNEPNIKGRNILFISNNPYICYQDAVAKRLLKSYGVVVETVGDKMQDESMENVLDTVARCLTNVNAM